MKRIVFLFLFYSCSNSVNIKYLLTNNSIKYWDLVENGGFTLKRNYYGVMFNVDNKSVFYEYLKNKRILDVPKDEKYQNMFKIINSKILEINEENYYILFINKDSLVLKRKRDEYIIRYTKSKDQITTIGNFTTTHQAKPQQKGSKVGTLR